jgi:putative membrane protein
MYSAMPALDGRVVRVVPVIAGAAGVCLAAWLLRTFGIGQVMAMLGNAGWLGLSAVIAFHLVQMAASAAGWWSISAGVAQRPGLAAYGALRLIREGVNNLLPVAQVGGPLVGIRLLRAGGMGLPESIATTVSDLTLEMVTQILFTMLGLLLLLAGIGGNGMAGYVICGLMASSVLAAMFVGAQWFGLGRLLEVVMLRLGRLVGWQGTTPAAGLHKALRACYVRPGPILLGAGWHMASWLLGGLEVCLALHVLGHDVRISTGLVIESLGQAFKAVGFVVPGALGVQEGGYVVICGLFHLSPEVALALSLIKRLREVVLGLPALAAWHWMERRAPLVRQILAEEAL